jgi:CMP-N-acetylneuraminic acid synthetase
VTRRRVIVEENSLYGARVVPYQMDSAVSVNIDGPDDWSRAEALMASRLGIAR